MKKLLLLAFILSPSLSWAVDVNLRRIVDTRNPSPFNYNFTEIEDAFSSITSTGGGSGDIEGVTAGSGLSGGGSSGTVTVLLNTASTNTYTANQTIPRILGVTQIQWSDGTIQVSSPSAGGGGSGDITAVFASTGLSGGSLTGEATVYLNLGSTNTWTADQSFQNKIYAADGTYIDPSISFISDTNSGFSNSDPGGTPGDGISIVLGGSHSFAYDKISASLQQYGALGRGSAGSPVFFLSDTNTGFFETANTAERSIGFSYNGSEIMRMGSGLVIGTTTVQTPQARLTAVGVDNSTVLISSFNATSANVTGADTFISFRTNDGEIASITGSGSSGVVSYNTFLGSHWTKVIGRKPEIGMVLDLSPGTLPGYAHLPLTQVSLTPKSRKVYGVYGGSDGKGRDTAYGLGAGVVIVSDQNGDIQAGDLLVSDGNGYAMRQDDDIIRSSTLGKASMGVIWAKEKKGTKLIGCIIYAGG